MNFVGFIVGIALFLIIGVSHPLVIKVEYYFGKRVWWVFFVVGLILSFLSMFFDDNVVSMLVGAAGFSMFWSTVEIFKQHKRVVMGRAKRNPNRSYEAMMLLIIPIGGEVNLSGLIVGLFTFVVMALGRWFCIKAEYWWSKRCWPLFLVFGLVCIIVSLQVASVVYSAMFSITGFVSLWGIGEVIEQEKRVAKGWFPKRQSRG